MARAGSFVLAFVASILVMTADSTPVRYTSAGDIILSPASGRKVYVNSAELGFASDVTAMRNTVNTLVANQITKRQYTWSSVPNGSKYYYTHSHGTYDVLLQAYIYDAALGKYVGVERTMIPCTECGSGVNGIFEATSSRTLGAATYQYRSFYIASGATVTVTGSAKLVILATAYVTIDGTLTLNGAHAPGMSGNGYCRQCSGSSGGAGVANGGNGGQGGRYTQSRAPSGAGSGGGQGGVYSTWYCGGGGGGGSHISYGGSGGYGRYSSSTYSGGSRGSVYGTGSMSDSYLLGGSGGGGGGAARYGGYYGYNSYYPGAGGGGGGGAVKIVAPEITLRGTINARGGNGMAPSHSYSYAAGGGGGSGGTIWLRGQKVTTTSTSHMYTHGGSGGRPYYHSGRGYSYWAGTGGSGGYGRVAVDGMTRSVSGSHYPSPVQRTVDLSRGVEYGIQDANRVFVHNLSGNTLNIKVVVVG